MDVNKIYMVGRPFFRASSHGDSSAHCLYPLVLASIGEDEYLSFDLDLSFQEARHQISVYGSLNPMDRSLIASVMASDHDFEVFEDRREESYAATLDRAVEALEKVRLAEIRRASRVMQRMPPWGRRHMGAYLVMAKLEPVVEAKDRQELFAALEEAGIRDGRHVKPRDLARLLGGNVTFRGAKVLGQLFRVPLLSAHDFWVKRSGEGFVLLEAWTEMTPGEPYIGYSFSLEEHIENESEDLLIGLEEDLASLYQMGHLDAATVTGSWRAVAEYFANNDLRYAEIYDVPREMERWNPQRRQVSEAGPYIERLGIDYEVDVDDSPDADEDVGSDADEDSR